MYFPRYFNGRLTIDIQRMRRTFHTWPVRAQTAAERLCEGACLSAIERSIEALGKGDVKPDRVALVVETEVEFIADTVSEHPERWVEIPLYEAFLTLLRE